MKTKGLTLSLAVIMSLQTVAFAQTDRTVGIADNAIAATRDDAQILQAQLIETDLYLERAENALANRKDSTSRKISFVAAALGTTMAAAGTALTRTSASGAGYALMTSSFFLSLVSGLANMQTESISLDETIKGLKLIQAQTRKDAAKATDAESKEKFLALNQGANEVQQALAKYNETQGLAEETRLAASLAQFASAISLYLAAQTGGTAFWVAGMGSGAVGNIATMVSYLESKDANTLLVAIRNVRQTIQSM